MAHKDLEYILKEIPRSNNVKSLVIYTIFFGMGIHIPDIDLIIHQGAWNSMMDYWQKVGRATSLKMDARKKSYTL